MENDKLLWDIESELEIFVAHIKRMRKNPEHIHLLDVDLLQDKTRKLYDKIHALNHSLSKGNKQEFDTGSKAQELPHETKKVENQEVVETKTEDDTPKEVEPAVSETETVEIVLEKEEEPVTETVIETKNDLNNETEMVDEQASVETIFEESETTSEEVTSSSLSQDEPKKEEPKVVRSTIDLFSDTTEETIADKFGSRDDSSIAKKMQQQTIGDLRQAIGINEKFLFINGLFNGDLGRYNKAIDEFNELSTKEGVNAHFLELKIHNQWSDDNDGVKKLKALLDRKFN